MPVVTIYHKGGKVTIMPQGYPGTTCHQATRPYEDARTGKATVRDGEEGVAQGVAASQQQVSKR